VENNKQSLLVINNAGSPFTEIFSRLIKYKTLPDNTSTLAYSSEELKIMCAHINNAVEVMLQGLQDIGNLLAAAERKNLQDVSTEGVGLFISATCNLIEALNRFTLDAEYVVTFSNS
jgi:hypothetical protein